MKEPFVHINNLTVQYSDNVVLNQLNWSIAQGQQILLGGKSGSGKSILAKAIAGFIPSGSSIQFAFEPDSKLPKEVVYISNWYQFTNLEGDRNFYYQQRYNRHQGQDTLTVRAELQHYAHKHNLKLTEIEQIVIDFGFENQLDAQLIELSSGEHKKLQLICGLWSKAQLIIIDEPYTGLDSKSRQVLNNWIDSLASEGIQFIVITNDSQYPRCINTYTQIVNGQIEIVDNIDSFVRDVQRHKQELPDFLKQVPVTNYKYVAELKNIFIQYGDKKVLNNISWKIKVGDKWVLQGPNGSGKSTLLSLINGDHPQAYGHDLSLFGNKRGSGESIWDIKQKIGIISPELHWYFDKEATVWHTIASGFYDSIGWFIDVKFHEKKQIEQLMAYFDLTAYKDQKLQTLSLGKQRLAMLARTIIKNPPLLVLDEPCQGLDTDQAQYFNDVVDELVAYGKTLIYVGHYESQLPTCIEHRLVLEHGKIKAIENIKHNTKQLQNIPS